MIERNAIPFQPVVGTEAKILAQTPTFGHVWFAKDTKKIYYSDGNSFLSMGGNTGVYYGIKEIPENVDTDQVDFIFSLSEIDGNDKVTDGVYKIPNTDDLILNIPDGCFYRVSSVQKSDISVEIMTTRLTIAGSGGGGGGTIGPAAGRVIIEDVEGTSTKYFTKDIDEAKLRFKITNPILTENNGIAKITYNIGNLDPIIDSDYKDFGIVEFDILPYLADMEKSSTYTTIAIQAEDLYGTRKTFYYYINVVNLSIRSNIKDAILTSQSNIYHYTCTPLGGATLSNKEIQISFYDSYNNLIGEPKVEAVKTANDEISLDVEIPAIGVFTMEVIYRGQLPNDSWVTSNILSYQIVYYDTNPQLIASIPSIKIEQYSTLNISYMVAAVTESVDDIEVKLIINGEQSIQKIKYNTPYIWSIEFETAGFYTLTIETINNLSKTFYNVEVYEYAGDIPTINQNGLDLNLTAINRSNTEVNKDTWTSGDYTCTFSNFAWGDINGWRRDEEGQNALHLSSGAKLEIDNFYPFDTNAMSNGQTIELDFKFSGVTDFSKGLIECLSYTTEAKDTIQVGFQVTGQESTLNTDKIKATFGEIRESDSETDQIYNTQIQGLTSKFIEGERIHLTWVIGRNSDDYPMIKTYLNGILSGITQYAKSDDFMTQISASPAKFIFDSTYGNIDIYNIRVYKNSALSANVVLNNYIATCGNISDRTLKYINNSAVLNNENKISIEKIETENINNGYILSVPYIKIIGGSGLKKDDDGYTLNTADTDYHLPTAKKDYRLIKKYEFIDPSGIRANQILESTFKDDGYLNGLAMYGQGTSSMEYPVKNLRIKAKMKDSNNQKIKFQVNDCSVDLICLKADYMESSGSHNTGTGNLVYNLTQAMGLKTPGQEYWTKDKVGYNTVSAIRGYPVLVFYKSENDPNGVYEFIGKYNFNLDKATHEPFGFEHDGTVFGCDEGYKEVQIEKEKVFKNYPFKLYTKTADENYIEAISYNPNETYYSIKNKIHCYEFLNNSSNLANFLNDEDEDFETTFNKIVTSDNKQVPNWYTSYESRYPEFEDYASTDIDSFYRLCSWINSTKDNPTKFKNEFNQYLNFNFTCFYYILTHVLLMIDSRAKNMMIATWDDQIWYPIFYDMDTMLGLNNYGYNKYHYDVEDTEPNIYNGQLSILWNNFREAFKEEIHAFYEEMQKSGLNYTTLLANYNNNQADAVNESIYNNDAQYKYIRPFSEGFIDSSGEEVENVPAGSRDYLYASQGNRSMHRKWWLKNRINYFNGKHLSSAYKDDKYIMRLYTPQKGDIVYEPVGSLTEEQFNSNTYYILSYDAEGDSIYTIATEYNENTVYYIQVSKSEKLDKSIEAVAPNNNFTLTPLYNQYLSVAYGGSNGDVTSPVYAEANKPKLIPTKETNYNDTETYLYGGSMLKDLGDLSPQYIGQFHFPNAITKLEKLILGNPHNDYYNPNFSSLTIGNSAPYLKVLDITNCQGLSGRGIEVQNCQNLQEIHAMGSGISSMSLPANGILNEVRLPQTLTSLKIIEQHHLTSDKFTIGSCNYNPETKEKTYTEASGKLITLRVENTPIDSYKLVMDNPNLQWFYLKDINWTINNADEVTITDDNVTLNVLEVLLNKTPVENEIDLQPAPTFAQAITGTITIKSSVGLTSEQALKLYTKYTTRPDNNKYFPNITFIFEGLNLYNVNIYDNAQKIIWSKKIIGGESIDITKEFLSSGPNGAFTIPVINPSISHTYIFENKWIVNGDNENIKQGSLEEDAFGWPIIDDLEISSDISLVPVFNEQLRKYVITFSNPYDEKFVYENEVEYGTPLNTIIPIEIPYRDSSSLNLEEIYGFVGYSTRIDDDTGIDLNTSIVVSGNQHYYAIFEKKSVYDNIQIDYFLYNPITYLDPVTSESEDGYAVYINSNKKLSGKITIPHTYNNKPVLEIMSKGFAATKNITHIFIGRVKKSDYKTTNLKSIGKQAFYQCEDLLYFDFPFETLKEIKEEAFRETKKLQPNYNNNTDYYFGNNLYSIETMAFNQSLDYSNNTNIILPSSLVKLQYRAFSYLRGSENNKKQVSFIIGNEGDWGLLDFNMSNDGELGVQGSMIIFNDKYIKSFVAYLKNENYQSFSSASGLSKPDGTSISIKDCFFREQDFIENGIATLKTPVSTEDLQ